MQFGIEGFEVMVFGMRLGELLMVPVNGVIIGDFPASECRGGPTGIVELQ